MKQRLKQSKHYSQQPLYPAIQAAPPLAALSTAAACPCVGPPLAQACIDQQAAASSQLTTELDEIATAYFKRFTTKIKDADTTNGMHDRSGKFYIGTQKSKLMETT
jgi:hypothetical protein